MSFSQKGDVICDVPNAWPESDVGRLGGGGGGGDVLVSATPLDAGVCESCAPIEESVCKLSPYNIR